LLSPAASAHESDAEVQTRSMIPIDQVYATNTEKEESWFGWGEQDSAPATSYIIKTPQPGVHTIQIISDEAPATKNNDASKPSMFVMLYNQSPLAMQSHLHGDYHQLIVNEDINMQTLAYDRVHYQALLAANNLTSPYSYGNKKQLIKPEPYVSSFIAAEMDVIMPNGEERVITMHDDGVTGGDKVANDGIFGGSFKATQEGTYVTQVIMHGVSPDGHVFVRSTQHIFTVIENDKLVIQKQAAAIINTNEEMMKLVLRLTYDESKKVVGQKFRAYAEVYGQSSSTSSDEYKPIAFVTGMAVAQQSQGENGILLLELQLSMKWLSKAGSSVPLELRNVYIQDSANNIPVATADSVIIAADMVHIENELDAEFLQATKNVERKLVVQSVVGSLLETKFQFNGEISETMLWGQRPAKYNLKNRAANNSTNNDNGVIVLLHGYCSDGKTWDTSAFTNFAVFEDAKQSRTNDDFALLVREFGDQHPSFSLAAHSQGGLASLHLKSFYWSNIDASGVNTENHRDVSSVGSPYYGNAMAGTLASIGNFLGIGCGPNSDMTRDGANLWLSSIPAAARNHIYYYTTQYKKLSWCNLAANIVLSWPNDGTAELKVRVFILVCCVLVGMKRAKAKLTFFLFVVK